MFKQTFWASVYFPNLLSIRVHCQQLDTAASALIQRLHLNNNTIFLNDASFKKKTVFSDKHGSKCIQLKKKNKEKNIVG